MRTCISLKQDSTHVRAGHVGFVRVFVGTGSVHVYNKIRMRPFLAGHNVFPKSRLTGRFYRGIGPVKLTVEVSRFGV
jgi:hypothetical protein